MDLSERLYNGADEGHAGLMRPIACHKLNRCGQVQHITSVSVSQFGAITDIELPSTHLLHQSKQCPHAASYECGDCLLSANMSLCVCLPPSFFSLSFRKSVWPVIIIVLDCLTGNFIALFMITANLICTILYTRGLSGAALLIFVASLSGQQIGSRSHTYA